MGICDRGLCSCNEQNAAPNDESEEYLAGVGTAFFPEGFHECGEEGGGGESGEADGDIGHCDGPEEAKPMHPEDESGGAGC